MFKYLPNLMSGFRLILVIPLIFTSIFSTQFYLIYVVGGITDILDGAIARRFGLQSDFGAKLDSLADFIFCMVVLIKVMPRVTVAPYVWLLIVLIFKIRIVNMIIAFVKFKAVSILHTRLNKITGILLFLYVFFMNTTVEISYQYLLCVFGVVSAIEETIIHLKNKKLDLNIKSIFQLMG